MDDTTAPLGGPPPDHGQRPGPDTGDPAGSSATDSGPRTPSVAALTDIHRTDDGRMVAGVCSGIGRYLGIDPVIPRILFVVLTFVGFGGVLAYAAAWVLLPDERTGDSILKRLLGLGENEPQVRLVGLGAAAVVAVTASWGAWPFGPLWVAALLVIAWVGLREFSERKKRTSTASTATTAYPYQPGPYPPVPYAAPPRPQPPYGTAPHPHPSPTPTPAAPASAATAPARGPLPPPTPPPPPGRTFVPPPPQRPVPPSMTAPRPPNPPNPRHDKGLLTLITLSLTLIVTGTTLVATSAELHPSLYVAVATGVIALGMLIGTVFGNARPLIFPALIAVCVLAVTVVVPRWDAGRIEVSPVVAADVDERYALGAGEIILDLSQIEDPEALHGTRVEIENGFGTVRVYVPPTVDVNLESRVEVGQISALGMDRGGFRTSLSRNDHTDRPDLTLDIDVKVGSVEVITS